MEPKVYLVTEHQIHRHRVDPDALYVVNMLREAGFAAYLVGGSIRDLLAEKTPKDFDISTSARPEQIKALFKRQCLLIGRRFRLAHVRFGRKVMEVSTFRSGSDDAEDDLIVQDNEWGNPEQDALRRDFTINGLFYDPIHETIIDYVGGWEDITHKLLRTIGNPAVRFRQDPVRMIRLLKFQARFGFNIEAKTLQALEENKEEIVKSAPARIFEEVLRMLESGSSVPFFRLMSQYELLHILFPCIDSILNGKQGKEVYRYLEEVDRIHVEKGAAFLDRSLLLSCLLFPILESEIQIHFLSKKRLPHLGDIILLASSLLKGIVTSSFAHFPKRLSAGMIYILTTQYQMTPLKPHRSLRHALAHHKDFHLALGFLHLRASINPQWHAPFADWENIYLHTQHHGDRRPHPRSLSTFRPHEEEE